MMGRIQGIQRVIARSLLLSLVLMVLGTASFAQGKRYKSDKEWAFGIFGDTQWTVSGNLEDNPNYVSVALAQALQQQLINKGVKFVIQPGDLTDRSGAAALNTRAETAQALFDQGIGFFPLRGNHETYGYLYGNDPNYNLNVPDFKTSFPQTQGEGTNLFGASNFSWPTSTNDILKGLSYSFDYGPSDSNARFVIVDVEQTSVTHKTQPQDATYGAGWYYLGWIIFKSDHDLAGKVAFYDETKGPRSDYKAWSAVPGTITAGSYFRLSGGSPSTNFYGYEDTWPFDTYKATEQDSPGGEIWPGSQQSWISGRLENVTTPRGTTHAFVFSHRGLMGANHADGFFGSSPSSKAADQNAFFTSMKNNGVKYMISAHDHIYNRALVKSPDLQSQLQQIITQGSSTKFYTPGRLDDFGNDGTAPNQTPAKNRETQIAQEIKNFGYFVYSVDGPRLTVDYYSDANGNFEDGDYYPYGDPNADPPVLGTLEVPDFNFKKQDTFGYSLNGKQFSISQGSSYTTVIDSFGGTNAKIIGGANNSTAMDLTPVGFDTNNVQVSAPRAFTKVVNTGWVSKPANPKMLSNIFSLWGMNDFGSEQTDKFALSLSFPVTKTLNVRTGVVYIAALNANGQWVNAVDLNFGGKKKYVLGPYRASYPLGTYGYDNITKTAWAVLNYNADFAVMNAQ